MPDLLPLAPLFLGHEDTHEGLEPLEPLLRQLLSAGSDAWPQVALPAEHFVRHLRRHCPADADPLTTLPPLYIEDLFLACACAHHLDAALQAFEQRYLGAVAGFLPRAQAGAAVIDEVRQLMRDRLLVGNGAPRIAEYSGRGSLLSFVRTVAVRTLLDLHRQRAGAPGPLHGDDDAAAIRALASGPDPELAFIKGRYRDAFHEALQDALRGLPVEQRNVLRLHYVDGLNLERVGVVLGIHRSTVYRWLLDAREAAQRATRALLCQRLQLSAAEFDSLAGLLRSQLDMNLARALP